MRSTNTGVPPLKERRILVIDKAKSEILDNQEEEDESVLLFVQFFLSVSILNVY